MAKDLSAREAAIMARLEQAANAGHPCPSNDVLAGAIGASSPSSPVNVMAQLQKRGLITVERFATSRIVTIIATGKSTFGDRTKPAHWRVAGAKSPGAYVGKTRRAGQLPVSERPAKFDEAIPAPVDRTPCHRCGVRADVGCRHSRASEAAYNARYGSEQKDGASIAPAPVPTSAGSQPADVACLVTRLVFFSPLEDQFGRQHFRHSLPRVAPQAGAGVDTPSGSSANVSNRIHGA